MFFLFFHWKFLRFPSTPQRNTTSEYSIPIFMYKSIPSFFLQVAAVNARTQTWSRVLRRPVQEFYIAFTLLKKSFWSPCSYFMHILLQVYVLQDWLWLRGKVHGIFVAVAALLAEEPFRLHGGVLGVAVVVATFQLFTHFNKL